MKDLVVSTKAISDHELVNAMDKVAILMHGVWVIRTYAIQHMLVRFTPGDLTCRCRKAWHAMSQGSQTHFKELTLRAWINPADKRQFRNPPKSPASFMAGKLQQCRDMLLMRLYEQKEILDKDILEIVPDEVSIPYLQAMLEPLCVPVTGESGSAWRPKLEDSTFAEHFPDHAARAEREWQMERLRLQASVKHEDNERLRMREAHEVAGTAAPVGLAQPATAPVDDPMEVDSQPAAAFPMTELHKTIQSLFAKHYVLEQDTVVSLVTTTGMRKALLASTFPH